jgi:hypothetical protein
LVVKVVTKETGCRRWGFVLILAAKETSCGRLSSIVRLAEKTATAKAPRLCRLCVLLLLLLLLLVVISKQTAGRASEQTSRGSWIGLVGAKH